MNFWPAVILKFIPVFFVVSVIVAINLYPGGNIHNYEQIGYVLSHNFLSDLGRFNSFTGEPNFLSMFLFNQAMFAFLIVGIAFLFIPNLYKDNKLTFTLAWLGSLSFLFGTIFFAFVGLTPYDLFFEPHVFFAVNAFRLIIPGILLYVIVLIRSKSENVFVIALSFLLAATIGYVIFQLFHNFFERTCQYVFFRARIFFFLVASSHFTHIFDEAIVRDLAELVQVGWQSSAHVSEC